MARRNQGQKPDKNTDAPVEPTDETAPAAVDESTTTDETAPAADEKDEKPTAAPVDLTAFQASVGEALTKRDEASGELPEEVLNAVNEQYRSLDGVKAKNQARKWIEDQMLALIKEGKFQEARGFVDVKDNLSAGSGGGAARTPADPTAAFVQRMASFYLAINFLTNNVGDDVAADWSDKVDTMVAEEIDNLEAYVKFQKSEDEDAEEPEVSPVVRQAYKLTAGKAAGGGSGRVSSGGPRRDVQKHIEQVFADEADGTFLTVNEIAKRKSTEYGDDPISAGAISARLFPKDKPPYSANGISAAHPDGKPRGAVKNAA